MLAFHNDAAVKAKYLSRVEAHAAADELLQGYGYWDRGKGCAIGCTIHGSTHKSYETELGVPEEVAYLEDWLFEQLPFEKAKLWPARLLNSITPGSDLSGVYDLWSAWSLIDPKDGVLTLVSDDFPDVQRIVRETGEACLRHERVNAAGAARAARAARAAWAAWAAEAAEAAGAAWAAGAAGAAGAAYYLRAADKLIELLESAPLDGYFMRAV